MNLPLPTPDEWPAISELLDEALARPPAQRAQWLERLQCSAEVRASLAALLQTQAEIEGKDFLEDLPRLDVGDGKPAQELAPDLLVGPYRLVSEIGVGGMGTVWLAERADGAVRRRVALKLPRTIWGGSFAERLARESRILATLEHEHIARLYDAGVDAQNRPFLALEYVEGQPIDLYCRERALSPRACEELLLQTMAAVAHAHSRLIVHRDLKPANILVTPDGRVKLLDFGIAKLLESERTEETALTRVAGRALTLDYASPEQIRGEPLGTASDVYSLGVVAFGLLAQARPYRLKRGTAAEMEEAIAGTEPLLASAAAPTPALRKALRGDLDAILNKALKKSVDERYPTIDAFAQDLQRHLHGKPVHARPDSRRYRITKFVRRNLLAVTLTSTLAASILIGAGVSVRATLIANRQEHRAETEVVRQQAVRDLYDETMVALSVMANEHPDAFTRPHAITQVLQDKLHEIEPRYLARPDARASQLEAVMLQLNYTNEFEASLAVGNEYLAFLKAHDGTPEEVIVAYATMAGDLFKLGRYEECKQLRQAGLDWAPEAGDKRTRQARRGIASSLANVLTQLGERAQAARVLTRADALASGESDQTEQLANQHVMANYYINFDERRQLLAAQTAHDGWPRIASLDPDQHALDLAIYGAALLANGRAKEAEPVLREAQTIYGDFYGRTSNNNVVAVGRLVEAVSRQADYARATALLDEETRSLSSGPGGLTPASAARLLERRLENAWLQGDVATLNTLVTTDLSALTTPAKIKNNTWLLHYDMRALALVDRSGDALAVMEFLHHRWPEPGVATAEWTRILESLALAQLAANRPQEARATARELASLFERAHEESGRTAVSAQELVALASARLGDANSARLALAAADRAQPPPPHTSDVTHADSLLRRAEVLLFLGQGAAAQEASRSALALLATQHRDSPRLLQARRLAGQAEPAQAAHAATAAAPS
jgi:serine/threonine-protein kinase